MLEHRGVPRHQTGRSETEDLPERKVPWHYGEYDSQGVKGDEALACLDGHRLAREKAFGMLRVEVTSQCAFLCLGDTIAQGPIAHGSYATRPAEGGRHAGEQREPLIDRSGGRLKTGSEAVLGRSERRRHLGLHGPTWIVIADGHNLR